LLGSLPTDWAKKHDIDRLVNKSHPLSIVAFSLYKILSSSNAPQEALCKILSDTNGRGMSAGLGSVYLPILQQAVTIFGEGDKEERLDMLRTIIGSLVLLYNPLSATSLSKLLGVPIGEIGALLPPLQSVLNVPEKANGRTDPLGAIKLFHLSFRDFLVDPKSVADHKDGKFWIDEAQAHK
jgi:hypothetical protein